MKLISIRLLLKKIKKFQWVPEGLGHRKERSLNMHLITFPLDIAFSDYYRECGSWIRQNIKTAGTEACLASHTGSPISCTRGIWPCSPSGVSLLLPGSYRTGQQIDIQCFALKTFLSFSLTHPPHAHQNPFSNTSPQCYSTSSVSLFLLFIVQQTAYSFHKSKFVATHK